MKKLSSIFVCTLLIGISAMAYGKSKPLADKQMDQISAGSAIGDGGSTASSSRTFTVALDGSALSGASSLNIVNAANSTVANGVNTWSGDRMDDANALQFNFIAQTGVPAGLGPRGAVLSMTETANAAEEDAAIGNAIALDGSTATDTISETVTLAGSAESNAKALNIVNAVGSLVANGVNTASSTNLSDVNLAQVNIIVQSAH
jgi:hypothetical protein